MTQMKQIVSSGKRCSAIFRKLAAHARDGGRVEFINEGAGDFRWKIEGGKLHQQIRSNDWHAAA